MQVSTLLRGWSNFEKYANRIEPVGNHAKQLFITTPTDDKSLIFLWRGLRRVREQ